jgi:hypothetical protein
MQYLLRKQIIILIAFLGFASAAFSQTDEVFQPDHDDLPYYLGMSLGMSNSFLSFKRSTDFLVPPTGSVSTIQPIQTMYINLGLSGTLKLTKHFLLRTNPTLLISGNRNVFSYTTLATNGTNSPNSQTYSIPSVIIDVPFGIKMQSDRYSAFRYTDIMRHYLITGVKFGFDLGAEKTATINTNQSYPNIIKGTDMAYEIGLGTSFYLRYATISPEVKFSYGLRDLRKISDPKFPLVSSLDKITSNFIYFTIHIEN